jgi:hypothetical protein
LSSIGLRACDFHTGYLSAHALSTLKTSHENDEYQEYRDREIIRTDWNNLYAMFGPDITSPPPSPCKEKFQLGNSQKIVYL